MFTLLLVFVTVLVGFFGWVLVSISQPYRATEKKETDATTGTMTVTKGMEWNSWGVTGDIFGVVLLVFALLLAMNLIVDVSRWANFRRLLDQNEGPHVVMDSLKLTKEPTSTDTTVQWKEPKDTALWIAVNVYTEKDPSPPTQVLPGTETSYELSKEWVRVRIWYGTAQGPSMPVEVTNHSIQPAVSAPAPSSTPAPTPGATAPASPTTTT